MASRWFAAGAIVGAIGVILGAFGAHGLRERISPEMLAVFETGARYHMIHALALLCVGMVSDRRPSRWVEASGWGFAIGIVLFSGSLYLLAVSGIRSLGAITPLGGLAFIAGWLALAMAAIRGR